MKVCRIFSAVQMLCIAIKNKVSSLSQLTFCRHLPPFSCIWEWWRWKKCSKQHETKYPQKDKGYKKLNLHGWNKLCINNFAHANKKLSDVQENLLVIYFLIINTLSEG